MKDSVMAALKKRGAAKALVHFSGGNDEGGVDSIELLDAEGAAIPFEPVHLAPERWDREQRAYVPNEETRTPQQIADYALAELLEAPVHDRYYSFAGEFYVSGTVTFDVAAGTAEMNADEEVSHTEYYHEAW